MYDDRQGIHLNGIYRARPNTDEAILCEASTGTAQVKVQFVLLNEGHERDLIDWYGPITQKAQTNTVKALRICGWTGTRWEERITIDPSQEVDLDISPNTYNNKTTSRVNWVNKVGETGGAKPMDDAKRKAFAARMNGALLSIAQAMGLKDDEAPF